MERNELIEALEYCSGLPCAGLTPEERRRYTCPFSGEEDCMEALTKECLKHILPRVMALEEVHDCWRARSVFLEGRQEGGPLDWYEVLGGKTMVKQPVPKRLKLNDALPTLTVFDRTGDIQSLLDDEYGITWRCWNEKPSGRQMIEEAWKDDDR